MLPLLRTTLKGILNHLNWRGPLLVKNATASIPIHLILPITCDFGPLCWRWLDQHMVNLATS